MKSQHFYLIIALCLTCHLQGSQLPQQVKQPQAQEKPTRQATELETKMVNEAYEGTLTALRLQEYINQGADINIEGLIKSEREGRSFYGTALKAAIHDGNANLVKRLIDAGADINILDKNGWTGLMEVATIGNTKIANIFINARADLNIQLKDDGHTALFLAIGAQQLDIVKQLVLAEADLNIQNNSKWTALMYATQQACQLIKEAWLFAANIQVEIDIVKVLLLAGARLDIKDASGKTAEDYAVCSPELQKVFLDYRKDKKLQEKLLSENKAQHEEVALETQPLLSSAGLRQRKAATKTE